MLNTSKFGGRMEAKMKFRTEDFLNNQGEKNIHAERVDLKVAEVSDVLNSDISKVLAPEALHFFIQLHNEFNPQRLALLEARIKRQNSLREGMPLGLLKETLNVRESAWKVAAAPTDLNDRRVEITGPAEPKMLINALNSGARLFMADIEDALSPTWKNIIEGQIALSGAVRKTLEFISPEGKKYNLKEKVATLVVRPRGWHLNEKHILLNSKEVSASIFDFAMYFFHNAKELIKRGSGPYFYLPKIESHLEARLWNQIFCKAQELLGIPQGTIRATVLIETITAAFEMEEILFELKEHAAGLNAGRWDYLFSAIKKFSFDKSLNFPDRAQLTMAVPFMKAYAERLVQVCHYRGAHAIGGMAAFIPSRKDPHVNEVAIAKVTEDKERESKQGFDGTWVAHPDLVPIAEKVFNSVLGALPNQKNINAIKPNCEVQNLIQFNATPGVVTEKGFTLNIEIALRYMERWLAGLGAVAIHNLMEDAATAEISRAQLWQWVHHEVRLPESGIVLNKKFYHEVRNAEVIKLQKELPEKTLNLAVKVLDQLVTQDHFSDFLTLEAYKYL
jgi:malate synthase